MDKEQKTRDSNEDAEAKTRDISYQLEDLEPVVIGTTYLLLIGINNYAHCPSLRNCVNDIVQFKEVMLTRYNYSEENIVELIDEEATKKNIFIEFRNLLAKITEADNLLIYFSGHGTYDKVLKEGFWVPVEANLGAVDEYMPNSSIQKILNVTEARHIFLISDSCYSGSLFSSYRSMELAERLEKLPSRWGLTSGRNEVVMDGAGDNSPFAESLLYQLRNADAPLGVSNLCNRVVDSVTASVNQTPRGETLRVNGHQGGQFFFHPKDIEITPTDSTVVRPKKAVPRIKRTVEKSIQPTDIKLPIITLLYDRTDKELAKKLATHLAILKLNKQIYLFDYQEFRKGEVLGLEWLKASRMILCLLSPSFFTNCYSLAEQAAEHKKILVPIYLKNVMYQHTFFAKRRGLPANKQFIADMPNKDAAFAEIVGAIQGAVR